MAGLRILIVRFQAKKGDALENQVEEISLIITPIVRYWLQSLLLRMCLYFYFFAFLFSSFY